MSHARIVEIEKAKIRKELALYDTIYSKMESKIISAAKKGENSCILDVPTFVLGHARPEVDRMTRYILHRLIDEKFVCYITADLLKIMVSWNVTDAAMKEATEENVKARKRAELTGKRTSNTDDYTDNLLGMLAGMKVQRDLTNGAGRRMM